MKKLILIAVSMIVFMAGCTDAEVASRNLSKASDQFEIERRIVFYNGINGEYMLTIEGRCSLENLTNRLAVTCRTGADQFKKHFLGLSDNVTYFAERLENANVSTYHYRVIFKPEVIIPDIQRP